MTALFNLTSIPPQLQHMQDTLATADVLQALRCLGYRRGSPGFKAIEAPVTPVDKAFQIYALHLAHSNEYGHEPTDHTTMWQRRDAAWRAGAQWLMDTQEHYKSMDKKTTRSIAKILPELLRAQCSLELPPGPWQEFPKDSVRKSQDADEAMNALQHLGLNIKVRGIAILEGESVPTNSPVPKDLGTLKNMCDSVIAHHAQLREEALQKETPNMQLF